MKYYIYNNFRVRGPYSIAQLKLMWGNGTLTELDSYCEEGTEEWLPLAGITELLEDQTPSKKGASPQNGDQRDCDETIGAVALFLPILGTLLAWFWVGQMNLFQGPSPILGMISVIVVVGTGILVSIEATKLGVGSKSDPRVKRGERVTGPLGWGVFVVFVWIIGFPLYMGFRSKFGRRNMAAAATLIAVLFAGVLLIIQSSIESGLDYLNQTPRDNEEEVQTSVSSYANTLTASEDSMDDKNYQEKVRTLNAQATERAKRDFSLALESMPPEQIELVFEMLARNTIWARRTIHEVKFLRTEGDSLIFSVRWLTTSGLITETAEISSAGIR